MSRGYLRNPASHGHQPPHRGSDRGRLTLKFHAIGCRVDGGTGLPPSTCRKCADTVANAYFRELMRIDQRTR